MLTPPGTAANVAPPRDRDSQVIGLFGEPPSGTPRAIGVGDRCLTGMDSAALALKSAALTPKKVGMAMAGRMSRRLAKPMMIPANAIPFPRWIPAECLICDRDTNPNTIPSTAPIPKSQKKNEHTNDATAKPFVFGNA